MTQGKIVRVHPNMYDLLHENAKKNNRGITEESRDMADMYVKAKEVEQLLGMDILKGKNKRPIWVLK